LEGYTSSMHACKSSCLCMLHLERYTWRDTLGEGGERYTWRDTLGYIHYLHLKRYTWRGRERYTWRDTLGEGGRGTLEGIQLEGYRNGYVCIHARTTGQAHVEVLCDEVIGNIAVDKSILELAAQSQTPSEPEQSDVEGDIQAEHEAEEALMRSVRDHSPVAPNHHGQHQAVRSVPCPDALARRRRSSEAGGRALAGWRQNRIQMSPKQVKKQLKELKEQKEQQKRGMHNHVPLVPETPPPKLQHQMTTPKKVKKEQQEEQQAAKKPKPVTEAEQQNEQKAEKGPIQNRRNVFSRAYHRTKRLLKDMPQDQQKTLAAAAAHEAVAQFEDPGR
jgi:hypothetical protein